MNGGVNGMMEESTELPHTDSPKNSPMDNDCSLNKQTLSNSEINNHRDSASDPIAKLDDLSETPISNGVVEHKSDDLSNETLIKQQEYMNNATETHCGTTMSNELCLDTVDYREKLEPNQEVPDQEHKSDDLSNENLIMRQEYINSASETHCSTATSNELHLDSVDCQEKLEPKHEIPDVEHKSDKLSNEKSIMQQEYINNATETQCSTTTSKLCLDSVDCQEKSEPKQKIPDKSCQQKNCKDDTSKNDKRTEKVVCGELASPKNKECSEEKVQQNAEGTLRLEKHIDSLQDSPNKNVEPLKEWPDVHSPNSNESSSPDVQVIVNDNDNCVITVEDDCKPSEEDKPALRRSSRAIKRKRYDMGNGDESDVEEVATPDPRRRSKGIVISNTRNFVDMATKQMKLGTHKKENTVMMLNTNRESPNRGPMMRKNPMALNASLTAQNLYQNILARGTTVTPVNNKSQVQTQSHSNAQPNILPSLTDDMYVVEAPSFIVPYVYEKPSVKPFREFVDELGKELEAQKIKEDELRKQKEIAEKEKALNETPDTEFKETNKPSGEVEDENSEEKVKTKTEENTEEDSKKTKEVKKGRRRKRDDEDDSSWDGSSNYSDDDMCSDEEEAIIIKDVVDTIDEIKDVTDLTVESITTGKADNYFDMSLGKFFMDIGLHSVQEHVQNDLLKQQNRKLYREKKGGHSTKATMASISSLMNNIKFSKEHNAPYKFKQHKCEFCSFKSESLLAMSHHLETPHMKNNVYKCNFCEYNSKSPHDILQHMETEHSIRGRLERVQAYHQCANCPFEDNGKGKLARHLVSCAKKYKPDFNLSPPVEWEPPAKIPKMARANNHSLGSYHNMFNKSPNINNNFGRPIMNNVGSASTCRPKGRSPMSVPPRPTPVQGIRIVRGGMIGKNSPTTVQTSSNFSGNSEKNSPGPKPMYQPSISITPLPRQPPPPLQLPPPSIYQSQNKSSCVICEICDGYIKDLEQLRNHMQWIHKVKIHPKMIYNRPPLNCQKCQFRFFTDQGLERHLLGSHGLVTSSMQEAANQSKDAGRCPVCGRVFQWKLLNHVTRDHKLTLKPAHLSYKCTVCSSTFGMYKQFENHVYSAHSVVAKRVMDKGKAPAIPVKPGQSLLKPLKINDEITIIPQPVKITPEK